MPAVRIFWDPEGREVDSLGDKNFLDLTDGDTPSIGLSVRMLSIDAPEVHYPGNTKPSHHDKLLTRLGGFLKTGKAPVDDGLAEYLYPKVSGGKVGTRQELQGDESSAEFRAQITQRLTRPRGQPRSVYIRSADEHFDRYGRLLAYLSPMYTSRELRMMARDDPARATFNLTMVASGWAAPFPIYPSIPRYQDLLLLYGAGKAAFESKAGMWADERTLTGYEFRMCYRLAMLTEKLVAGKQVTAEERKGWVERYCVDMTTAEVYPPHQYYKVKPYARIFVWPADIAEAVSTMNLVPA